MILHNKVQRLKNSSVMTSRTPLYNSLPCGLPHWLHSKTFPLVTLWLQQDQHAIHSAVPRERGRTLLSRSPPADVFVSQAGIGIYSIPNQSLVRVMKLPYLNDSPSTRLFSLFIYQVSWILSYPHPKLHPVLICRT